MAEVTTIDQAQELHQRIMKNGNIAGQALIAFAQDLKKMRDEKLYLELGYDSFVDYCEQAVGLKTRQVYNYINVIEHYAEEFLQSNANLGIRKLELIGQLPPEERQDFIEQPQLLPSGETKTAKEMTTRETEEVVKKIKAEAKEAPAEAAKEIVDAEIIPEPAEIIDITPTKFPEAPDLEEIAQGKFDMVITSISKELGDALDKIEEIEELDDSIPFLNILQDLFIDWKDILDCRYYEFVWGIIDENITELLKDDLTEQISYRLEDTAECDELLKQMEEYNRLISEARLLLFAKRSQLYAEMPADAELSCEIVKDKSNPCSVKFLFFLLKTADGVTNRKLVLDIPSIILTSPSYNFEGAETRLNKVREEFKLSDKEYNLLSMKVYEKVREENQQEEARRIRREKESAKNQKMWDDLHAQWEAEAGSSVKVKAPEDAETQAMMREILKAGYQQLAKQYHPDKPENAEHPERMVALNNARDYLLNVYGG